jgi:hypothetical protein
MVSIEYATTLINPKYNHVLEFGVFQGSTISMIRNLLDDNYKVFGFDSFEGLPEDWINTPCNKGCFTTNGLVPNIDGVKFFKGWFEETIPEYLKDPDTAGLDTIGLLHIDCDLYSSTKTIFKYLYPYIKSGTIIAFDEWCYNFDESFNDHEQKAFYEYVEEHDIKFEFVEFLDPEKTVERKIVRIL